MCGIVGYVGREECVALLLKGLERLEYRGYDSAGVAVIENGGISLRKAKGRLANLQEEIASNPLKGVTGIGHTRWATHGEPSFINAHPHVDVHGRLAIVHNGIIENYYSLRKSLEQKGIVFASETDTEVIAQLLGYYYDGDMLTTLYRVLPMLEGSFALGVLDASCPETLYCTRKGNPLIVGKGETGSFIASDIPAILEYTRDIFFLDDYDIAVLSPDSIRFYDEMGNELHKESTFIDWDMEAAEKDGFPHFMLKEIHQQPKVIRDTLNHYVNMETLEIRRETMPFTQEQAKALNKIMLLGCGTAYHAGLAGKSLLESLARIRTAADVASEYRYRDPIIDQDEAFIVISQSGETADTIAAMRLAKANGNRVVALCNVIGSTIAREADTVMYTLAGPEIAVASTKAYVAQLLLFELIALDTAHLRGYLSDQQLKEALQALDELPSKAEAVIQAKEKIQYFASQNRNCKNVFFIGRLLDQYLSMEAALKLKEISYIHSDPYAAGELKHGTIALIEEGTLVVAMATQKKVLGKLISNIEEVKVRGAKVIAVASNPPKMLSELAQILEIPETPDMMAPLLAIIPMQLFAYYMALQKGCDIDKPRNLAKSVTVE
ncbi:MAG TPA: glutamine--fructose-6-phosphate transaminase (isomerizing) [Peptococcaceae bacterium]|nr:glutamine--fructose-6-phosphate transaminase (isomerizing) [Peptococcaceae bacterium]